MTWSFMCQLLYSSFPESEVLVLPDIVRVSPRSTGVILTDMQEAHLEHVRERELLIANQLAVLQQCARFNIPVVVLEYEGDGPTVPELTRALGRVTTLPVVKPRNDGFCMTRLHEILQDLNVRTVVPTGVLASHCLRSTAETATMLGYRVASADNLMADDSRDHYLKKSRGWWAENTSFGNTLVFA